MEINIDNIIYEVEVNRRSKIAVIHIKTKDGYFFWGIMKIHDAPDQEIVQAIVDRHKSGFFNQNVIKLFNLKPKEQTNE